MRLKENLVVLLINGKKRQLDGEPKVSKFIL
jgi:hypothetical protein